MHLGNHEYQQKAGEPDAMNLYFNMFPNLKKGEKGFHNYYFQNGKNIFVSLCSGHTNASTEGERLKQDTAWNCNNIQSFERLMRSLKVLLDSTHKAGKLKNVFIQYHKPSFSQSVHPPLAKGNDPLTVLTLFKKSHPEVNIYVFNGHNHTTEIYKTGEGILLTVTGGGGASQKGYLDNFTHCKISPKEKFWSTLGTKKKEVRINYFVVSIDPDYHVEIQEMALRVDGKAGLQNRKFTFVKGVKVDQKGMILPPEARQPNTNLNFLLKQKAMGDCKPLLLLNLIRICP